jgi:P-aminobenzoate N-oxygenase AurF
MIKFVQQAPSLPMRTAPPTPLTKDLTAQDAEQIAEIFQTPLSGAYTWNYAEADSKLRKLYRLGKERSWNVDIDIDWSRDYPKTQKPIVEGADNPYVGWDVYEALAEQAQTDFGWHLHVWTTSQFLHGEQGALLVASQLVSCAPTHDGKLYAASQTFDEARHVEVFARYLNEKMGFMYPVNRHLKALLDKILSDERWDLKFIGMQLIIESLALAAFNVQKVTTPDPVLRDLLELVLRDEARHVAFGVTYMEQFVKTLSPKEVEERALFAFEACRVMRERIVPTDVFEHYGWDPEEGRRRFLAAGQMDQFRNLLFTRIMPNLNKVGLLPPSVHAKYDELGLMQFAGLPSDGEIDWAQMSQPLPGYDQDGQKIPAVSGFFGTAVEEALAKAQ